MVLIFSLWYNFFKYGQMIILVNKTKMKFLGHSRGDKLLLSAR